MNDLGCEIGFGLLRFALPRHVLEPERHGGSGVVVGLNDLVDTIRTSFDIDVERAVRIGVEKEALKPTAFAGHRARGLRQPLPGVGAERRFEGVVAPFDAAMFIHDGDRRLQMFGDDVFVVCCRHCGTVIARSCWSLASVKRVVNWSNGLRMSSFCRSRRPSMSDMR